MNDLKFAGGSVAKKDYKPELLYFRIADGRIYGYNGTMAVSTPTDLAVVAMPKAATLIKAIEKIPDGHEVVLNLTAAGRLGIKAGPYRAYVECLDDQEAMPEVEPGGPLLPLPEGILPVFAKLAPFMGIDASRPWARGILLKGQSAFATNNIVLIEQWLPYVFPGEVCIPADAVKEMIRIGIEPVSVQLEESAVTFHYPSGAWLRTQINPTEWPDIAKILDRPCGAQPIPAGFFDGVDRLAAFADKTNRIYLRGGTLATHEAEGVGACIDLEDFGGVGCHYLAQMAKLDGVAETIDFSMYPGPCLFFGGTARGAIVGLRMNDAV